MWRTKSKQFIEFDTDNEFCFSDKKKLVEKIWNKKICLEVWTGNWKFFSYLVKRNPDLFCVWCDLRKDRLIKTKRKVDELAKTVGSENFHSLQYSPKNFALSFWDARETINFLPDISIEKFFINFPDPRPPKWEWKYRFFQLEIIEKIHEKLARWGKIYIKTDDFEYFYFTRVAFFFKKDLFREYYHSKDVYKDQNTESEEYICTEFEEKWLEEWKKIYELIFEKK